MPPAEIDRSKEPIRLFKSDFLEFFSHIHPAVVLAIYLPIVALFVWQAVRVGAGWRLPVGLLLGAFLWTLAEYSLHRWLFHFHPRNAWQERVSFLFHGVHHAQPMSKTRLVMPPVVSLPLAALFWGLYALVVGRALGAPTWVPALMAGFLAGYVAYDMLHYSLHHFKLKGAYLLGVRRQHMRHHGQTPNLRFGVTSNLWDRVFGTLPQ